MDGQTVFNIFIIWCMVVWNVVDIAHLQNNVHKLHHEIKQLQEVINADSN